MYTVDFSDTAIEQLLAIPYEASIAVGDVLAEVSLNPWGLGLAVNEPLDRSKPHRCAPFDGGLVWYLIYEPDELVWVTEVQWLG